MSRIEEREYWVPEHVREYLHNLGFHLPLKAMEGHIRCWHDWSQAEAFRIALLMLGDLCGFGISYFDFDDTGHMKTATEVSSDNSALMRNIAKYEHVLERSIAQISRAAMHVARAGRGPTMET